MEHIAVTRTAIERTLSAVKELEDSMYQFHHSCTAGLGSCLNEVNPKFRDKITGCMKEMEQFNRAVKDTSSQIRVCLYDRLERLKSYQTFFYKERNS